MFTLRYPHPSDPYYLLTHINEVRERAWRFSDKELALNAYNAGLRYRALKHRFAHLDQYNQAGKAHREPPELVLDKAWREFEAACVAPERKKRVPQVSHSGAETAHTA